MGPAYCDHGVPSGGCPKCIHAECSTEIDRLRLLLDQEAAQKIEIQGRLEKAEKDRDEWNELASRFDAHLNRVARALKEAGVLPFEDLAEPVGELRKKVELAELKLSVAMDVIEMGPATNWAKQVLEDRFRAATKGEP